MTFLEWWKKCWAGGYWSQSKLNSRKFLFAATFVICTYISTFIFVKYTGMTGSTIIENGVDAIRDVIIAYFAMNVVEAGVNIYALGKDSRKKIDEMLDKIINMEKKNGNGGNE
jgi:hypothetical protein